MSDNYLGEVMLCPYNFAPKSWAFCAGQLLPISQNAALFSLLGTQFGGNGTSNFGLPDLRGRVPIGFGQGPGLSLYSIGEMDGVETVTLLSQQVPGHTHMVNVGGPPQRGQQPSASPANNLFGENENNAYYAAAPANGPQLNAGTISLFPGGSQPHDNRMPYLVLNWCIALVGVYPPRS